MFNYFFVQSSAEQNLPTDICPLFLDAEGKTFNALPTVHSPDPAPQPQRPPRGPIRGSPPHLLGGLDPGRIETWF